MSTAAIERLGLRSFRLSATQILPLPRPRVFAFFEDPRNLPGVIPPWLDFCFDTPGESLTVAAGAEFDYTIRWLGVTLRWRSRITGYKPPHEFTDVQVEGPYAQWEHRHIFTEVADGTRVDDEVHFALPTAALPFQGVIRRQLAEIFRYRGEKLAAWARDDLQQAEQD